MADKTTLITEIGQEVLRARDLQDNNWDSLSLVIDLGEGHFAQSGYLYSSSGIAPFTAITSERRKLSGLCNDLREQIREESGSLILQMLVQIRSYDSNMKVDFEFDDATRWSITPANMRAMKEKLRPKFE